MKINLISSVDEGGGIEQISSPNQVYAWFLHKAFVGAGVNTRLVKDSKLKHENPPETDHTLVISSATLTYMATEPGYTRRLMASTSEKLMAYFNTDQLRGGDRRFIHCFTQIPPRSNRHEKYICVGWGVDPDYSYPEQDEKSAFLDSKVFLPLSRKRFMVPIYEIYDNVLPTLNLKIYNPVPLYHGSKRLPYLDYQSILRKCHFFLCTQLGEGGLSRLEAAACGSLLVVPRKLYRKKTMRLLNNRIWHNEEELRGILSEEVDIEANRKRALEHRWEDVVQRMLEVIES